MSLRARLALLTSLSLAIAIVVASISIWVLIRWSLLDEVDQRLLERNDSGEEIARMTVELHAAENATVGDVRLLLQGDPIGVQLIDSDGQIARQLAPGDFNLELDENELSLLGQDGEGEEFRTVTFEGSSYRVMTTSRADGGMLRLFHPLDGVESTMTRIAWLLAGVSGVGVALAAGLGWVTAKAGLRPVDDLVAAAEQVARTRDLAHRIEIQRNPDDEVARLARSFNAMLAALDRARGQQRELVENAGHELRTPLATLRNDLGLLTRAEQQNDGKLDATDRAALLSNLESEAASLSDLVSEVIDLARGEIEPEPLVETEIYALVERAATRTRRINPAVDVVINAQEFTALVRPESLERAVANLIRNAVQVSENGSVVEVNLSKRDSWATIEVCDRGPGIGEHDRDKMFDRFYRGEGSRERQGTGLGLAIVAQVAALHAGSIDAANRSGGGAVLSLRFPIDSVLRSEL